MSINHHSSLELQEGIRLMEERKNQGAGENIRESRPKNIMELIESFEEDVLVGNDLRVREIYGRVPLARVH